MKLLLLFMALLMTCDSYIPQKVNLISFSHNNFWDTTISRRFITPQWTRIKKLTADKGVKYVSSNNAINMEDTQLMRLSSYKDGTVFAGVKFKDPISSSLECLGIRKPTAIQNEAILAISMGLSCIIHAETGSGKTLCYLLPLLKKLSTDISQTRIKSNKIRMRALILVPSKELAIQVAADAAALMNYTGIDSCSTLVHLCTESGRDGLDSTNAPIIVGTPYKLMDAIRASSMSTLENLNYLVIDEVDHMLQVYGKYASKEDRKKYISKSNRNPVKDIVTNIVRISGFTIPSAHGIKPSESSLQVVVASATIGRPLRRELTHILSGGDEEGSNRFVELPILRATPPRLREHVTQNTFEENKNVIIDGNLSEDDMPGSDSNAREDDGKKMDQSTKETVRDRKSSRSVGIPSDIRHMAVLLTDQSDPLSSKISKVKELWTSTPMSEAANGMLFVPHTDNVHHAIGMLSYMGLKNEVIDLQAKLRMAGAMKKNANKNSSNQNKEKRAEEQASNIGLLTQEMVARTARRKLDEGRVSGDLLADNNKREKARSLYVLPFSGARGLHLKNVEYVIATGPPKTMDEYLHVAGRTGRAGNTVCGTVITLATYEELKRLKSWETPLGITFDVLYD